MYNCPYNNLSIEIYHIQNNLNNDSFYIKIHFAHSQFIYFITNIIYYE